VSLPALYELAGQYREALAVLAESDYPDDFIRETLDALVGEVEHKAINVAMFARNLEAAAEAIKTAEGQMATRRKALEARAARLREYLKTNMERAAITEISCPHFALTIRRNPPSVVVTDPGMLPVEYLTTPEPPPPGVDKRKIGEALKAGATVPGAYLDTSKTRLEIR
jgi:hypothetical protein